MATTVVEVIQKPQPVGPLSKKKHITNVPPTGCRFWIPPIQTLNTVNCTLVFLLIWKSTQLQSCTHLLSWIYMVISLGPYRNNV